MAEREPWPKLDTPPALDVEDVRARGKQRPQHQGFRQLVTVLTIEGEIAVEADRILSALERAAQFRRNLARGEEHPESLKGLIEGHLLKNEPIRLYPNGWMKIGFVLDPYVPPVPLAVWWHETTDRVRVERPESWPELPERTWEVPLRTAEPEDTFGLATPVIAQPGYIYTYEGVDYSPEEAMVQARKLGNIEGWTWRKA
jgi:hypothetical protein